LQKTPGEPLFFKIDLYNHQLLEIILLTDC